MFPLLRLESLEAKKGGKCRSIFSWNLSSSSVTLPLPLPEIRLNLERWEWERTGRDVCLQVTPCPRNQNLIEPRLSRIGYHAAPQCLFKFCTNVSVNAIYFVLESINLLEMEQFQELISSSRDGVIKCA